MIITASFISLISLALLLGGVMSQLRDADRDRMAASEYRSTDEFVASFGGDL